MNLINEKRLLSILSFPRKNDLLGSVLAGLGVLLGNA
jgi:hypothetical protein